MSSSKSDSASSSQTQSVNEDNRVVADNSGIALGKDAIYNFSPSTQYELSPNMVEALKEFVSLVRDAGEVVVNTADKSNEQAQATVAAVTAAIAQDKAGTTGAWSNMVPLLIGAVVLVIVFGMLTNRK